MSAIKYSGENYSINNLRVRHIFGAKRGNIFWKYVDILACKMNKVADLYQKTVGKQYRREIEKFDLSKDKKILHIGCGAYPITAMVLAETGNAKITTIDKNPSSIKLAKEVIKRKNLSDKIKAELADGTTYHMDGFDTVIISGCSVPKVKVLEHIIKNAKPKSKIIVRDTYVDIEALVNKLAPEHKVFISQKMQNHAFASADWTSYCILKN